MWDTDQIEAARGAAGPSFVCPECGGPVVHGTAVAAAGIRLSAVERELLGLLLQGYRVSQIATQVGVTVPTVRKRVRRLLAKTGTASQAELVARFRTS